MKPELFIEHALEPALDVLPAHMNSSGGKALVVAICLQESKLMNRRQVGGPARGYAQFEKGGGVRGVLTHGILRPWARLALYQLDYKLTAVTMSAEECYIAIEHNDILAAVFARLLLYSLPQKLPTELQIDGAWNQYIEAWRPGKPHRETWNANYAQAWKLIK